MGKKRKGDPVHGWLVLDKPAGLTSTQALGKVRRLLNAQKAGHGGTLDPLATGILPIACGEATKLVGHVMGSHKTYRFTVRWGEARNTDDCEGAVTASSEARPSPAQIEAALPAFTGTISQRPPAFSAVKVAGERAYDLARAGEDVMLQERSVTVHAFRLCGTPGPDLADFEVDCGKGTYIRALARDLALKLGTYGHITALRRTRVGPFAVEDAISLEKLEDLSHNTGAITALKGIATVLDDIPAFALTPAQAHRLQTGQPVLLNAQMASVMDHAAGKETALATQNGTPVALVTIKDGMLHPARGFNFSQ
ncbi:MAG: tRNA pseudouridine(55) synthase TruB [Alphaproteobacteria bacterium]|nr:tRNA pseudouridine(55) synthase TruB [Alphaproteobacteria bacterium]